VAAAILFAAFVMYHLGSWVLAVAPETRANLEWLLVVARIVVPFGFLFALVEADLWAGQAGRGLIAQLLRSPSPRRWREAVARVLEDPATNIGYLDVDSGRYVDVDGRDVDGESAAGRLVVEVTNGDQLVAKIVTDPSLVHEPELLSAATEATLAAIEQGRLEYAVDELTERVNSAGAEERRRIQRDLHDSAQQRLVALRVHLALAQERLLPPEEKEMLERFGLQLDEALQELRTVARGEYPRSLERDGLSAALRELAERLPDRVTVITHGSTRHAAATERAIYYCCTEAIQNALKHAGRGARVSVLTTESEGVVSFVVEDDGDGFDVARAVNGSGLSNMRERLAQVGGRLMVQSRPGRGARISGSA
jgi:signal transduction histidine kinase